MRTLAFPALPLAGLICLALGGCSSHVGGLMASNPVTGQAVTGPTIRGKVHGGNNPITGASVYLYAVATTGYGTESTSLLTSPVTTDSNGNFSISGDYSCPSATSQVYIYTNGGNPGLASGTNNTAAGLMAGLGSCSTMLTEGSAFSFITVNEVSTVATAYALEGFATDFGHISSSGTTLAQTGVANAMANIGQLETLSTGLANSSAPTSGSTPNDDINTLANILAACVNTTGAVTGPTNPTPCYTLFNNARSGGSTGTVPSDTATAAINIAHNPGVNVSNLFSLQGGSPPFVPDLSAAPNDFTLAILYPRGQIDGPYGIAVDAMGDIWVTNIGDNSIAELSPLGVVLTKPAITGNGLSEPYGIAIDGNGYLWVADYGVSGLSSFTSTGAAVTSTTTGGLNTPEFIAIDASNNLWVDNLLGAGLSAFTNSSGTPTAVTGSPFGSGVLDGAYGMAIDTAGNIWLANKSGATPELVEYNSTASSHSTYTGGGLGGATGLAIDPSGNIWISDTNNENDNNSSAVSKFSSSGGAVTGADGYVGGGLDSPYGIAIDSNGNVFVANEGGSGGISEFNSSGVALSSSSGFGNEDASVNDPYSLAIDGSGNLWVAANGGGGGSAVVEYVGIAAPVVTPIAANLQSPYAANNSAVNRP